MMFYGIHLRVLSYWVPKLLFCKISLESILLRLPAYWLGVKESTHWGRVTHICIRKLSIIGSDNGLSPGRRQSIIWTNAGILLIGPLGTNFSEILIEIQTFFIEKNALEHVVWKMSAILSRPQCVKMVELVSSPCHPLKTTNLGLSS